MTAEPAGLISSDPPVELPVARVRPDPDNPRRAIDPTKIVELAASIARDGLLHPIHVRPGPKPDEWFIVAGERRWRAFVQLKRATIPAVIRNVLPVEVDGIRLVENLQREDLNLVERARGYEKALQRGASQTDLARMLGMTEAHVSQVLAVLDLPAPALKLVEDGTIGLKHAREFSRLKEFPEALADEARTIAANLKWEGVPTAEALKRLVDGRLHNERDDAEGARREAAAAAKRKELTEELRVAKQAPAKLRDRKRIAKLEEALAGPKVPDRPPATAADRKARQAAAVRIRRTRAEKAAAVRLGAALARQAGALTEKFSLPPGILRALTDRLRVSWSEVGFAFTERTVLNVALDAMRDHLRGSWTKPPKGEGSQFRGLEPEDAKDDTARLAWLGVWALWHSHANEVRGQIRAGGKIVLTEQARVARVKLYAKVAKRGPRKGRGK